MVENDTRFFIAMDSVTGRAKKYLVKGPLLMIDFSKIYRSIVIFYPILISCYLTNNIILFSNLTN